MHHIHITGAPLEGRARSITFKATHHHVPPHRFLVVLIRVEVVVVVDELTVFMISDASDESPRRNRLDAKVIASVDISGLDIGLQRKVQ